MNAIKSLFFGEVPSESFSSYPALESAEAETLEMVVQSVRRFLESKEKDFREYDREGYQPESYLKELSELGLFGLIIPEEYGGLGLSAKGYARVLQEVSRYDGSTALTVGAHSSIGMKGLLLYGSKEQKAKYLPKLATGEWKASFCLTEAGAGSDAASIKTTAEKQSDGSWTLTGEKIWITNGAFAKFFTVFARTNSEGGKISAFIVERDWEGVSTGPKEDKMGIRASATVTVSFQNVRVPAENLLGEEGKGFKIAMAILNSGRSGLGGGAVGGMKRCIELACHHANNRKQFNRTIGDFALIQEKIAQMTVACFATEAVVQMVGHAIDTSTGDYSLEAAVAKIYSTESLWAVSNEALQIAGGNGFMKDFPYERIVRDSRINMIFEGTNEILRMHVALSALKDSGEYLAHVGKSVTKLLEDPIKGFGTLSQYAGKKISQANPLKDAKLPWVIEELEKEGTIYARYAIELNQVSDAALRMYKGQIIEEQIVLKHLSDTVIDLFVGLCVMSRISSMWQKSNAEEKETLLQIGQIFTQQAKRRMANNLRRVGKNEGKTSKEIAKKSLSHQGYPFQS